MPGPANRPPSVDSLAREIADVGLPHPLLVDAARSAIEQGRPELARSLAERTASDLLRPVINGTGVLIHTNLGRVPAVPVSGEAQARYSNVEIDMSTGRRGSRSKHAAALVARACGAASALVVNNGAAAVLLVMAALARGADVVVSRGELVEIGGGFRIPEVVQSSGAQLVEVGTTNRTRLSDYVAPCRDGAALVLKVHQSNYRITGFTEAVGVSDLATLGPPVVADIGSGLLDSAAPWLNGGPPAWLDGEPAARQTLAGGATLVTFSCDKLFGGPQAGVIAGREDLVARCARHPLARALRPGSLILESLQATALSYLRGDGDAIPFWRMATADTASLRARAGALGAGSVVSCTSVTGGGSAPGVGIPSAGIALEGDHSAALRAHVPPVIAVVREGRTIVDLRGVDPADDPIVAKALVSCAPSRTEP